MTDYLQFAEQQTLNCYALARKYSKYNVLQQFVEILLLQNKPWLVRYKKIKAMSFLPSSVECGKFKLKQAFQNGKILACSKKKSEICATSTLKLIKMMLKCQATQASSTWMLYYNLITRFQRMFFTSLLCTELDSAVSSV